MASIWVATDERLENAPSRLISDQTLVSPGSKESSMASENRLFKRKDEGQREIGFGADFGHMPLQRTIVYRTFSWKKLGLCQPG